jgi:hypothetical protein
MSTITSGGYVIVVMDSTAPGVVATGGAQFQVTDGKSSRTEITGVHVGIILSTMLLCFIVAL